MAMDETLLPHPASHPRRPRSRPLNNEARRPLRPQEKAKETEGSSLQPGRSAHAQELGFEERFLPPRAPPHLPGAGSTRAASPSPSPSPAAAAAAGAAASLLWCPLTPCPARLPLLFRGQSGGSARPAAPLPPARALAGRAGLRRRKSKLPRAGSRKRTTAKSRPSMRRRAKGTSVYPESLCEKSSVLRESF